MFLFAHQTILMDHHLTKIAKEVRRLPLRNIPLSENLIAQNCNEIICTNRTSVILSCAKTCDLK